ncbi:MAG: hypothetical protein ACR2GD_00710 [Pyrinomonadaceae bacterium]
MRFQILFFITILSFIFISASCASQPATNNSVENKTVNTNTTANSNSPLATAKTPETATSNDATTLAPVVQNYFDALRKKDEAGARKFLSASALKYWQDEMKSEKSNSLLAILEDDAAPVEAKREVRNEKIEGDSAVAEIKGGSSAVWTPVKFVKENGDWKFASPKDSFALQDIKQTNSNSSK